MSENIDSSDTSQQEDRDEWICVGTTYTNTTPGSIHAIELDMAQICENMSNKKFRQLIARLRDAAIALIRERIHGLAIWDQEEQRRVQTWFGRSDDIVRQRLNTGLPKLLRVMQELKPENVIRWDEQTQRNITCTVFPDNGITDAAVCKPDSHRRIIAIYPHFCTLPDARLSTNCKLKVLIHECSHYIDTFNSNDEIYGFGTGLKYWAQTRQDIAIDNADSLACYVSFFDDRILW
ncbi:M35 family metallo-endopeptidase [Burkholderia lata]|uniref:M35 family metallo-endopeptidase n=1 Tax=Burkholderia lata (strain ATCC 17760 / DSM 23089 / LMG 22485 / NCIMB 9086 / R18194 / 383) TaxID=482957 RepID=UPI00145447C1|nr:M35 family metallo-endopeptidase [Burkholderia lata]VWM06826.1 peptidase M35 [Burkholderia lata]